MKRLSYIIPLLGVLFLSYVAMAPPIVFPKVSTNPYWSFLVSYWKLDEESGIRFDYKGVVNLTNTGTAANFTTGVISNCLDLDGSMAVANGYWTGTNEGPVTLQLTNYSWTIFLWFWPNDNGMDVGPPYGLAGKWAESTEIEYCLRIEADDKVSLQSMGNDGFDSPIAFGVTSTNTVTLNAWNFVVGTYNEGTQTLSISLNNSVLISTASVPSNWSLWAPFAIGTLDSVSYPPLQGKIDETAVFTGKAFNQTDVEYWWRNGNGRPMFEIEQ